jgi:hypothetical protein
MVAFKKVIFHIIQLKDLTMKLLDNLVFLLRMGICIQADLQMLKLLIKVRNNPNNNHKIIKEKV